MSLEQFKLHGKTAWITGGSKGLGLQMANALASVGANIVISSRSAPESAAAAKQISETHKVRAIGAAADVTKPAEIQAVVAHAEREVGGIDILVNNAGINIRKSTIDMPLEDWQQVIDINLTGPFICSKAAAPGMIKKGWGRIIYMSSMLGQVGLAARPPYTASKSGLILLAKTQALEFAKNGITVNAICPGPFGTEMNKPLLNDPAAYQAFVSKIPMGRWGEMHEIEGIIIFLASNASSYITGTTVTIDGGWTAQ
jgi:NAD(P)-dependent dehydrogenase (short-subunit alcohol dehydrogenase family)